MDWEALSCECESMSTTNSSNADISKEQKKKKNPVFNANEIANIH